MDRNGYNFRLSGLVAQLVEQWTENPCVGGSIPPQATNLDFEVACDLKIKQVANSAPGHHFPQRVTNAATRQISASAMSFSHAPIPE